MINLEKIKYEKCQPLLLRRTAPAPYFYSLFLFFRFPSPLGEVIKISSPPLKKRGWSKLWLGVLLICCLINIIMMRCILYSLYLYPCLRVDLFVLYLWDLFFISIFIFILINHIISWIQAYMFSCSFFRICPIPFGW